MKAPRTGRLAAAKRRAQKEKKLTWAAQSCGNSGEASFRCGHLGEGKKQEGGEFPTRADLEGRTLLWTWNAWKGELRSPLKGSHWPMETVLGWGIIRGTVGRCLLRTLTPDPKLRYPQHLPSVGRCCLRTLSGPDPRELSRNKKKQV